MKKLLYLLFLNSLIAFSQDNTYHLEGNIGKSKIYLTIEENESDIIASYFYQNSLKDILLEGTRNGSHFTLEFKDIMTSKTNEKFDLTKVTTGNFKGFWSNSKNKKIPIELYPIHFSNYKPSANFKFENETDKIKMTFLQFKQESTTTYNGKQFIWYSEKHCNSKFFRIGNNFPEKTKSIINPILTTLHLQNTLAQLNCSSRFEYNTGSGIENSISINYLNSNVLGFTIFSSWDCGGAHPDFGGSGYLLDLNNGKQYELDEIIAFDKSATTEKKGGFEAFSNYREKYFAPKLFSLINENEHFKKPKNEDEDCDYTELDIWDFVSWNFTEKGIEFTPYFARVARSCEEPFLVPFAKLENYKSPTFPYPLK